MDKDPKTGRILKGNKKQGGRVKGTPNKSTADLKNAIMAAYDKLGGVDYLVDVGRSKPETFCTLLGKVLPKDIIAEVTVKSHEEALRELE